MFRNSRRSDAHALINFHDLRRSLVVGYGVSGLTAVTAVLVVKSDHGNAGLLGVAGFEFVVAAMLAGWRSMPVWVIKVIAFGIAVLVISAVVAFANPVGPAPLYYIWPALTCAQFGTRQDGRLMMTWLTASFALALLVAHDVQVPGILFISVVSIVGIVWAISSGGYARQRELTLALADAAATDGLTCLLNRRAFNEAFAREVDRALSANLPLSLVVFDLDYFKDLNDGFGHAAGDEALCAFSSILREQTSASDLVARVGGEEFAAVLFDKDLDEAQEVVDRIAQELLKWSADSPKLLTTSAGIAELGPKTSSPKEMLVAADRALYAAKDAGRNRVVQFGTLTARELASAA